MVPSLSLGTIVLKSVLEAVAQVDLIVNTHIDEAFLSI